MKISDKQRLDWLQKNGAMLDASCAGIGDNVVIVDARTSRGYSRRGNVRKAIDAAIRASKAGKGANGK